MSPDCTHNPHATPDSSQVEGATDADAFSHEVAELEAAWSESALRSLERRSRPKGKSQSDWRKRAAALLTLFAIVTSLLLFYGMIQRSQGQLLLTPFELGQPAESVRSPGPDETSIPSRVGLEAANRFAENRAGTVAFSVIGSDGKEHQRKGDQSFVSASVVKAPLLVAELNRLERQDLPLDSTTRSLLTQMITVSDNAAADAIYGRVGDAGLRSVARQAGMKDFAVEGYWANAQITADDMAQFAHRLDDLVKGPYKDFANEVLSGIASYQRWGIPRAVGERWRVRLKGGWRTTELGALAHQFAQLDRDRASVSLAVLTDGQISHEYATETIHGVAARLLIEPDGDVELSPRR